MIEKVDYRFFDFCLANKFQISSLTYAQCRSNLLLEEIIQTKYNVRVLKKDFDNLHSSIQQQIISIGYAHVCTTFLKINELKLKSNSAVQQNNFCGILKEKLLRIKRKSSLVFLIMSYRISKSHFLLKV